MTSIAFHHWDMEKTSFTDIFELIEYASDHFQKTELLSLSTKDINSEILHDMNEAKKLSRSEFINI